MPKLDARTQRPGADFMAAALCTALDAIVQTEEYATKRHDMEGLNWTFEDLGKLAITLYIDARKEGK